MLEDELESPLRIDAVIECDLDDRAEPLVIALGRGNRGSLEPPGRSLRSPGK